MRQLQTVEEKLAKYIVRTGYIFLSSADILDIKFKVLDWLGCALHGADYSQAIIAKKWAQRYGKEGTAFILGERKRYAPDIAAFVNAVMGHVCEFDDGHRLAIGHPGAVVIPVALSFAAIKALNVTGEDFIAAVSVGYEIFARIGACMNPRHYECFHTTGTVGCLAAMGTAAYLLKLHEEEVRNAVGLAATMSAGLVNTFGTDGKVLNVGQACMNGIKAAELAKLGFSGPHDALTGDKGFIRAFAGSNHVSYLDFDEKRPAYVASSFYKKYASCGHTHASLDLIFKMLSDTTIDVNSITTIAVETYQVAVQLTGTFKNRSEKEAKFSIPYCLAVSLKYQNVGLQQFEEAVLHDEDVIALGNKILVTEDAEATKCFPKRRCTIKITFKDGHVLQDHIEDVCDTPDYSYLQRKFTSLAQGKLRAADTFFHNAIENLDEDLSKLLDALTDI